MSINVGCNKRIKPKLLREQKTEALLVFIRTTLEQYFKELDDDKISVTIGTHEHTLYINTILRKLLDNLQKCVVNSTYLRNLIINGENWIPELMVIALLSEWILEEEHSVYLYPFLEEIDYMDLLEKYDLARLSTDDEKKEIIMDMYKLSTSLIKSLKNINYKINKTRKKRKK
jgi:hypothetical protein